MCRVFVVLLALILMLPSFSISETGDLGMSIGDFITKYNAMASPLVSPVLPLKKADFTIPWDEYKVSGYTADKYSECMIYLYSKGTAGVWSDTRRLDFIRISSKPEYFNALITIAGRCADLFVEDYFNMGLGKLTAMSVITYYYENNQKDDSYMSWNALNEEKGIYLYYGYSDSEYYFMIGKDNQEEESAKYPPIKKISRRYLVPEAITSERYNSFTENMKKSTKKKVSTNYTHYKPELLADSENREELIARFPNITKNEIYVLKKDTTEASLEKLEGYFAEAGYTESDFELDQRGIAYSYFEIAK